MAIYYVGTSGSNANAGTLDRPFATADAASAVVQPGDTVYFLAGTYHNASYGALNADGTRDVWNKSNTVIRINNVNGTDAAPITYAAAPGAHVKLQFDGNGAVVLRGSSHIRSKASTSRAPTAPSACRMRAPTKFLYRIPVGTAASGNTIYQEHQRNLAEVTTQTLASQGAEKPTLYNAPAISMPNGSHHIEIVNNSIHDTPAHAIAAQGGNDYITVRGNTIYNTTLYSSNGTHAVSFKALNSFDTSEAAKIIVEGNTLHDNYNLLISWVTTKNFVTMAIDEGKTIHVQNSISTADPATGSVWNHGQIVITNNVVEDSGNAGITVNEARGVAVANNTIVNAGYINQPIAQDGNPASPYYHFFSGQGLPANSVVAGGGIRLSGTDNVSVVNNLISMSDPTLRAVDAAPEVTHLNTTFANNLYSGGTGLLLRSGDTTLAAGFTAIANPGFQDAAHGDYRLISPPHQTQLMPAAQRLRASSEQTLTA
jgi:hypothetical protein